MSFALHFEDFSHDGRLSIKTSKAFLRATVLSFVNKNKTVDIIFIIVSMINRLIDMYFMQYFHLQVERLIKTCLKKECYFSIDAHGG